MLLSVENLAIDIRTETGLVHPVTGISFSVSAGEVLALVGESGSGKSLSALAVMGLLPAAAFQSAGSIRFEGAPLENLSDKQRRLLRGREMAMVFQDPMQYLNPVMTCGAQVGEALRSLDHMSAQDAHARVIELFHETGLPDPERQFKQYPHELSGGMRQRVLIAMMLTRRPKLLVADEPTTALDATVQAQILDLLRGLSKKREMGLLLITHDLGAVARVADRAAVMHAGQIVETIAVSDLFTKASHPYTQMLLSAMPNRISIATQTGQAPEAPSLFSPIAAKTITPLLAARDIKVHYPVRSGMFGTASVAKAVDGIDLTIHAGETVAIVGESGSGKSTLGRALIRLGPVTSGELLWEGKTDLLALSPRELRGFRREAQMVFQDPYASLNPRLSAGYLVAEPLRIHGLAPEREMRARIAHLLESVGLKAADASKYPHQFSGGQRQRLAIARALAVSPKLVVADEPVASLDMSVQAQVLDLLEDLRDRLGLTYVFISHDLAVVERISDRIIVMLGGKVVEQGLTKDVYANPQHPYTQTLLEASLSTST